LVKLKVAEVEAGGRCGGKPSMQPLSQACISAKLKLPAGGRRRSSLLGSAW
jgi:hypothetical protein